MEYLPRTWAEIDIDRLHHNYKVIRNAIGDKVKYYAIVKADAYGHGVKYVVPEMEKFGVDGFAVSNIEEAMQLRTLGIKKDILILGYTPPQLAKALADNSITQALFNSEYAHSLSKEAAHAGVKVRVHIKIDTGMGRIGFVHRDRGDDTAVREIRDVCSLQGIIPEGAFMHFASSDKDGDKTGEFTREQYGLFCDILEKLRKIGITFKIKHCCNSAATLGDPDYHMDAVRPGIIMYGMAPSPDFEGVADLLPAMKLKSVVSMVKTIEKGDCVSYGRTFTAEHEMKVATIPVGYADGYPRNLSNHGYVLIHGQKAPIVGRVCMDQMIVDVSGIDDVRSGTQVVLFGEKGLSIEEFSALCGTINYETVCVVGKRVPRVYIKDGKIIGQLNYVYNGKL